MTSDLDVLGLVLDCAIERLESAGAAFSIKHAVVPGRRPPDGALRVVRRLVEPDGTIHLVVCAGCCDYASY